jgi:hypothetical protein
LQPDPQKDLNQSNWVLASSGKRAEIRRSNSVTVITSGEGEPAREDQGTRAVLAGGDVMVEVNRRGGTTATRSCGDRAQLRRRCSSVAAHRWWSRGWGEARGKQDGSIDHLGEG